MFKKTIKTSKKFNKDKILQNKEIIIFYKG